MKYRGFNDEDFEKVADFFDRAVNLTVELKVWRSLFVCCCVCVCWYVGMCVRPARVLIYVCVCDGDGVYLYDFLIVLSCDYHSDTGIINITSYPDRPRLERN